MSKNPNTVESQDDVTVNQGSRSSDVLLATVEKCEKLQKQLDVAVKYLKKLTHKEDWRLAREGLKQIEELNNDNAR